MENVQMALVLLGMILVATTAEDVTTTADSYQYHAVVVGIFVDHPELSYSYEVVTSGITLAIQKVSALYPHIQFQIVFRNTSKKCLETFAGAFAAEEFYLRKVSAFIGPGCTFALDQVGRMASYWNLPVYTAGGIDDNFLDKALFSTLTRLSFSLDRVSNFLLTILRKFQWRQIALLVDETDLREVLMAQSIERAFKREAAYDFEKENYYFHRNNFNISYRRFLISAGRKSRVFILIAAGETVRNILLEAYALGMGNGDYVFLSVELIKNKQATGDFNWYQDGDTRNNEARKIYESLMVVAVRVPTSEDYRKFVRQIVNISLIEYGSVIDETMVNPIVAAFYDCVLMYAWSLNKTLAEGGSPTDGFKLVRQLWNTTFTGGLTGNIFINENGDREADYTLNDLDPVTGIMKPIATYFGSKRIYETIDDVAIHWPKGKPPPDVPYCGFLGDAPHCRITLPFPLGASISIVILTILAIGLVIGVILHRRVKLESQLADFWWRVRWDDITFADRVNWKSMGSLRIVDENSTKVSGSPSNMSTLQEAIIPGLTIGIYKGIKIAVKSLNVKKLTINRSVLMDLKQMRDLTHENLVRFVGLSLESPNFAILSELSPRGSLQDMLENDSLKIDWIFRYSMISDIVEGLAFIHKSPIGVHGRLKSSNCVIDGRFVVKLADYGLKSIYDQILDEENLNPRSLFWCAPEHLRELYPKRHGSKTGDIYSLAIILQELITRLGPFETFERLARKRGSIEPEEILDRVRMGTIPPFRPEVSPECGPGDLLALMRKCWAENPEERPSISEIKSELKIITKGVSSKNFLDNLLNRMEQYANNLESLVEEKTQSLIEEKKKTEELLYQLLPKYVADELKKGRHVTPEAFESVTIFFSDVVGFTPLAAESSPMQVVDLLNDLYSCFDSIIDNYNVYKVETIGDAYMVVSGLPIRNGHEHAKEIARMSLSIRDDMSKFCIRHRNDKKLQVRIGVHSGPCAAGVVGLKMPRYCLFGDTVNTASRMESNGLATKIHVSSETKSILDMFGTFRLSLRGDIEIKGKGIMRTFWLEGEDGFDCESVAERTINIIKPLKQ